MTASAAARESFVFWDAWVQARHVRPRDWTWWQTYARLKLSVCNSGDVTHANTNTSDLFLGKETRDFRAIARVILSPHEHVRRKIGCGVLSRLRRCHRIYFGLRSQDIRSASLGMEIGESLKNKIRAAENLRGFQKKVKAAAKNFKGD